MAFTIPKTIGTGGNFSTVQLWEDGAPANLVTAEKSAAGTFLVAGFTQGEALSFIGSGATGKFLDTDSTGIGTGTYISYGITAGNPAAGDTVTGATSGATCVLSSSTPTDVGCVWQGQCKNQEFVVAAGVVVILGGTTSSSAYKELTTEAGASFRDNANAQTNALRYNAANGAALRSTSATATTVTAANETFAKITNLQIAATGANARGLATNRAIRLENLIIEGTYTDVSTANGVLSLTVTLASITAANCAIIQRASGADNIVGTIAAAPSFYNCTFAAADDLAAAPTSIFNTGPAGPVVTVQNCGLFAGDDSKALVQGSATFNFTTCFSDIGGTSGVTQATYADQFEDVTDAARDFRLKDGADMIDAGTTDATNAQFDIVGTERPQGSAYDVGCWELIGGTPPTPTPTPEVAGAQGYGGAVNRHAVQKQRDRKRDAQDAEDIADILALALPTIQAASQPATIPAIGPGEGGTRRTHGAK